MSNNQRNPTTWGERFDSLIGIFNPQAALKRKLARMQLRATAAYEGAAPWRNSANFIPLDGRAEILDKHSRDMLRAKARHLERNSEVVNSILNAFIRNVVGKGFNLQVKTDNPEWNSLLESIWNEWGQPGNCDVTGQYSLTEILGLIVRRKIVDGGVLIVKTVDKKADIPLQLQLREVDELDSFGATKSPAGNPVVDGIEVNEYGKPLSYYFRQYDLGTMAQVESEQIDAQRVYFLLNKTRPTQIREITPLARAMDKINDLDEFFQAVIFAQKITAATAIFITTDNPTSQIGRQNTVSNKPNSAGERIDPGSIKYLNPGEKVETLVPSGQASELQNFNLAMMRQLSSGQGLSYEQVSRDVSQVNYSSARQNLLEDWKAFATEQRYLVEHFLDDAFKNVILSAVLSGKLPADKLPKDFYLNLREYLKHEFTGQSMPWIDPYKEALANKIMLESHQMTLKEYCAKSGRDYEEVIDQVIAENEKLGKLALAKGEDNAQKSKKSDA